MYEWAIAVAGSPSPAKKEMVDYIKKFLEVYVIPLNEEHG